MSYIVPFSDPGKASNPITVNDLTENTTSTSLSLPGRNFSNYGISIAKNFVQLLENFSSPISPNNSIEGQLWYDNAKKRLFINDSTAGSANWRPASGTFVAPSTSVPQNPILGDLWVDTLTQQLRLYNGNDWILVGPSALAGKKSGIYVEIIVDAEQGIDHFVTVEYNDDIPVKITATESFIPQRAIDGFVKLNPGINISQRRFIGPNDTNVPNTPAKIYGTATSADSLNVTVPSIAEVSANNFARRDVNNIYFGQQTVLNDAGLTLGSASNFILTVNQGTSIIRNTSDGGSIDFIVTKQGAQNTILKIDGQNKRVGINHPTPNAELDVFGDAFISGHLITTGSLDSTSPQTGSLQIKGGAGILKNLYVGKNIVSQGHISVGEIDDSGNNIAGVAIIPNQNLLYDIGSPDKKFKTVYAETFNGNFSGDFAGTVVGDVVGSATGLANPTEFEISGDVVTITPSTFTGGGGVVTLQTKLNDNIIRERTEVIDNRIDDELLVFRQNVGLRRVSRTNFLLGEAFIPIGTIFPFAGTQVPLGYLLCDGSLVARTSYPVLFQVVGTTYGGVAGGAYFRVPDLRGRFPLGNVDMTNSLQNLIRSKNLFNTSFESNQIFVANSDDLLVGMTVTSNEGLVPSDTVITAINDLTIVVSELVTLPITATVTFTLRLGRDSVPLNDSSRISKTSIDNTPGIMGGAGGASTRPIDTVNTGTNPLYTNSGTAQSANTNFDVNVTNPYLTLNYIIRAGVPAVQQ
jgi:microcystin-dependent protein